MNTDILEEQAMGKIYNLEAPDELKNSQEIEIDNDNNQYDIVSKVLDNHKNDNLLQEMNYRSTFSYLKINDNPWQWHFIKFFDDKYGMILSTDYIIDYSSTDSNSEVSGTLVFRKDKEYLLEYERESLEDFQKQMEELKQVAVLLDSFKTERQQYFYEYEDYIYLYQDNYVWKLSGYTKNDITEYYQMYILLMSLEPLIQKKYRNKEVLKYLYLIEKNAITYLYKGIDLKKKKIASLMEEFQTTLDVVTISLDNDKYIEVLDLDYLLFKRRKIEKKEETPITVYHKENWSFEGTFKVGLLGNFLSGELLEYNSILNSKELREIEKKELLKKIVIEKKEEFLEKKDYLNTQFLLTFFKKRFEDIENYFEKENWLTFIKVESLPIQELSIEEVEKFITIIGDKINSISIEEVEESEIWKEFLSYIDFSSLKKNIIPLYLTITPIFTIIECNIFHNKMNYVITEDYQILEWDK